MSYFYLINCLGVFYHVGDSDTEIVLKGVVCVHLCCCEYIMFLTELCMETTVHLFSISSAAIYMYAVHTYSS